MDAWLQQFPNAGTTELYNKIGREPKLLDVDMDAVFEDTPLHKVVRKGLWSVALEILQLMPSQGRKLNPQGYSPLHLALISGNEDLVRAMIKLDPQLIRVAGRERITPLHYAAEKNLVRLLTEFLCCCPDSIEDLTIWGQTAVHVAVTNESKEAFKALYKWVHLNGREKVLKFRDWEDRDVSQLAAATGQREEFPNVGIKDLYESIGRDPTFLDVDKDAEFVETPLHKAVTHGHSEVALEILRLMPSYGRKMNPQGYSPLHIALAKDNGDLVWGMIKMDPELIRVPGKEGITPLHYTAEKNKVDFLAEFLLHCPNSIMDLTVRGETALHVAVNHQSVEAFKVLLGWVTRMGRFELLKQRDWKANSVLVLATKNNQKEVVELLDASAIGLKLMSLIFLDVQYFSFRNFRETMKRLFLPSSRPKIPTLAEYLSSPATGHKCITAILQRFKLEPETSNAILMVAVLIATATFTVLLSLPGGAFSDNGYNPKTNTSTTVPKNANWFDNEKVSTCKSFIAILNTMAFLLSLIVMVIVLPSHWSNMFLYPSLGFLLETYLLALMVVLPNLGSIIIFIAIVALAISFSYLIFVIQRTGEKGRFTSTYWRKFLDDNEANTAVPPQPGGQP